MKKVITIMAVAIGLTACKNTPKEAASAEPETPSLGTEMQVQYVWTSLFNGEDFSGWHAYNGSEVPDAWTIEDGAMVFTPRDRKEGENLNLVTDERFESFELSLEAKISEGGNSGIFWSVVEDPYLSEPYISGPEIQVLDNERHPDSFVGEGTHKAGALYDMIAPSAEANKAGEWNHYLIHINHRSNEGFVMLNGEEVVRFPVHGPEWEAMKANSKFANWEAFGASRIGKIGVQDHGDIVAYRNIKIRQL